MRGILRAVAYNDTMTPIV